MNMKYQKNREQWHQKQLVKKQEARNLIWEELKDVNWDELRQDFLTNCKITSTERDQVFKQLVTIPALLQTRKNPVLILRDLKKAKIEVLKKLAKSIL